MNWKQSLLEDLGYSTGETISSEVWLHAFMKEVPSSTPAKFSDRIYKDEKGKIFPRPIWLAGDPKYFKDFFGADMGTEIKAIGDVRVDNLKVWNSYDNPIEWESTHSWSEKENKLILEPKLKDIIYRGISDAVYEIGEGDVVNLCVWNMDKMTILNTKSENKYVKKWWARFYESENEGQDTLPVHA